MAPASQPDLGFYYRLYNTDVKLIRTTLEDNGFREARKKDDWTVMWGSGMFRSQVYEFLGRHQKINHFPKSHEITKKDCLFKNLSRMQAIHGLKHFQFVPKTYLIPQDAPDLTAEIDANPDSLWIVKPSGSSQGKGIFITNRVADIPPGQSMVACRYIENPFLIDGLKFDLRIYVAVTSMNPMRVYIYKEGLVRFATELYSREDIANPFIHLTNYSVNKKNPKFVSSCSGETGSKWALSSLSRYYTDHGLDFPHLWSQIKDIALKTIISIESVVTAAIEMHVPSRSNCFELFGFDILVDASMQPWLLEVNLSPSMNCDTGLDLRLKTQLVADLFTLIGVRATQERPRRARSTSQRRRPWNSSTLPVDPPEEGLTREEQVVMKETDEELQRMEGFERLFPAAEAGSYKQFFESDRPLNNLLLTHVGAPTKGKKSVFPRSDFSRRLNPLTNGEETRRKLPPRPPNKPPPRMPSDPKVVL